MKRSVPIALMLFLLLAACSSASGSYQGVASAVPLPADAHHPITTRVGMQEIDSVLKILVSGDTGKLRSIIQFTTAPCTQADGLGGPPKCRAGERKELQSMSCHSWVARAAFFAKMRSPAGRE